MLKIFTGKSCSGKDYQAKKLLEEGYFWLPECTTRPRRGNEVDGIDKYFYTDEEYNAAVARGDIIESRTYNAVWNGTPVAWQYGTPSFDFNKNYVYAIDILGVFNLVKNVFTAPDFPSDAVEIIYLDVSDEIRTQRAIARPSYQEAEWLRRKADDNIKYSENRIALLENMWGHKVTRVEEN